MIRLINIITVFSLYMVIIAPNEQTTVSGNVKLDVISLNNSNQVSQIMSLPTDTFWVSDLRFNRSGEVLAVGEANSPYNGYREIKGKISIWATDDWIKVQTLEDEQLFAISLAFSDDNNSYVAVGYTTGEIQIWDWANGEIINILKAHNTWVNTVALGPGNVLLSGSGAVYGSDLRGDSTVKLWLINSYEEINVLIDLIPENTNLGAGWAIGKDPTGGIRAVGMTDGKVRLWGSESNQILAVLDDYTREEILFTPDGSQLLFPSYDGVHIWSIKAALKSFGYVPEYRLIAPIIDTDVPLEEREFIFSIALSPDGTILAAGYQDGAICLWDMATGERLVVLEGHEGRVPSLAFSPDGTLLASGGSDGTVRLWGIPAGE